MSRLAYICYTLSTFVVANGKRNGNLRILLLVSGMSPQIITETLYALAVEKTPPWLPDEVHLVTTEQGQRNAVLQLLEDKKRFDQFLTDYQITHPIRFDSSTIHLIRDSEGTPLVDLRTPEDNEAAADTICNVIRTFTQNPDHELHVSLAGGRKTMGYYAGYALSLFGRPQDRLSHVLVSEHYENNPDFFYPTPYAKEIYDRNKIPLDTRNARVWLAEIPFVRMRNGLPRSLLQGQHSFSDTVQLAQLAAEKSELKLFPTTISYTLNGIKGQLPPVQMALLLWAAYRKTHKLGPIPKLVEGETSEELTDQLLNVAQKYELNLHGKTLNSLSMKGGGVSKQFLETTKAKLNRELENQLGLELAELCKLVIRNDKRGSGYALPENLEIFIE